MAPGKPILPADDAGKNGAASRRGRREDAKISYDETLVKAAALKVGAITALSVAGSLFAAFLALMLVFVFIKIEVDLRDIRDGIKGNHASVQP